MKKLRDDRGETLVEVLAAILVASLSVALLFSCVMASSDLDVKAKSVDEDYYQALSAADGQAGEPSSGQVTISSKDKENVSKDMTIDIYGGEGLYSYRRTGS